MAAVALFQVKILQLCMISEISHKITCKGYCKKKYIDWSNGIYGRSMDIWKKYKEYQTDEQNRCADFSFGQSTGQHFMMLQIDDPQCKLKQLFDNKKNQHIG